MDARGGFLQRQRRQFASRIGWSLRQSLAGRCGSSESRS
jgi:hypothetical protein